jgi:hypothetical protein
MKYLLIAAMLLSSCAPAQYTGPVASSEWTESILPGANTVMVAVSGTEQDVFRQLVRHFIEQGVPIRESSMDALLVQGDQVMLPGSNGMSTIEITASMRPAEESMHIEIRGYVRTRSIPMQFDGMNGPATSDMRENPVSIGFSYLSVFAGGLGADLRYSRK